MVAVRVVAPLGGRVAVRTGHRAAAGIGVQGADRATDMGAIGEHGAAGGEGVTGGRGEAAGDTTQAGAGACWGKQVPGGLGCGAMQGASVYLVTIH